MSIMIALNYIEQFFIIILSVSIHEITHIVVASLFGLHVEKIIITPLGEIACIDEIDALSSAKKSAIWLAGPMINILMAVVSALIFPQYEFFKLANISIGLFNLLPIFPFDGGRISQCILSHKMGVIPAGKFIASLSSVFSNIIIFLGFIQVIAYPLNISLLCMGLYLSKVYKTEYLNITFEFFRNLIIRDIKLKQQKIIPIKIMIADNKTEIKELLYKISWDYYYLYHIYEDGSLKKLLTEHDIINHIKTSGILGTCCDIL